MRALLLLPWALCGNLLFAQELPSVKDQAKAYVDALAGPGMHGRGYVAGGDSIAAEWIAQQFDTLGLATLNDRRFQRFGFPVNTFPDSVQVRIDGTVLRPGIDFIVDPASGPSDGTWPLVHVHLADFTNPVRKATTLRSVDGKAVMLHCPATHNADTLARCAAVQTMLAQYVPVIRQGGDKLTWSVAGEAMRNTVIEVKAGVVPDSASVISLRVRNVLVPEHDARNVMGVVHAKGKNKKWLVVTAHYDHLGMMGPDAIFPGANDNASGISMLLSVARQINARPIDLNVLFIAFAGEEAGLKGSTWFAAHPLLELDHIKLLINLDLNGTGDEGITVVNAIEQKEAYDRLVSINERTQRFPVVKSRGPACNSDHCPFAQLGVPAIFIYTMGGVSYYHDVYDRPETLPLTKFDALYRSLIELMTSLK